MRRHRRAERAAPNKPATVLWALAHVDAGGQRLVPFREAEPQIRTLLEALGARGTNPAYGFWRLAGDGFWEVSPLTGLPLRSGDREPLLPAMRAVVSGGFVVETYNALRADPDLAARAIALTIALLEGQALTPVHDAALLAASGLADRRRVVVQRAVRDHRFSRGVLCAYEHRCAMCGFGGRLGQQRFGVEAAHIQAVADGGPDSIDNGLPLCSLHHVAFDRGAITVDASGRVRCSSRIAGHELGQLMELQGVKLRKPIVGSLDPSAQRLAWHRDHVFQP